MKQPDFPGPGEQIGPDYIPAEAHTIPIPERESRGLNSAYDCRQTQEIPAVKLYDPDEWHEWGEGTLRRTGTERDRIPVVNVSLIAEARIDYSVYGHEEVFDPVQDDSGPHMDQG